MRDIFLELGLILERSVVINISVEEFKDILYKNIDNSLHVNRIDATDNDYRGRVIGRKFKIKENVKTIDSSRVGCKITGQIKEYKNGTIVEFEASSLWSSTIFPILIGFGLLVSTFIYQLFSSDLKVIVAMMSASVFSIWFGYQQSRISTKKMVIKFVNNLCNYIEPYTTKTEVKLFQKL